MFIYYVSLFSLKPIYHDFHFISLSTWRGDNAASTSTSILIMLTYNLPTHEIFHTYQFICLFVILQMLWIEQMRRDHLPTSSLPRP